MAGIATYRVIPVGDQWSIDHDGTREGSYESKEAAFEAIVGAASNTIRDGLGVRIEVPARVAGDNSLGVTD